MKAQTAPAARQLNTREAALIRAFRRLSEQDQSHVLRVATALAESAR